MNPRNIDSTFTSQVRRVTRRLLRKMKKQGFTVDTVAYGVEAVRGRARYRTGIITVPKWILLAGPTKPGYVVYYTAHELAHLFAKKYNNHRGHGPAFMAWLKRICPKDYLHYELDYKPRHAFAAGIRRPPGYVDPKKQKPVVPQEEELPPINLTREEPTEQ